MKRYWELVRSRVDDLTLRERVLIFLAGAFVLATLANLTLLDPLFAQKDVLVGQIEQRQEKMKELQAQLEALLQAKRNNLQSPLRSRVAQLNLQLQEQDEYLQKQRNQLVAPERMAELLKQMLNRNGKLQLLTLQTLPVSMLLEPAGAATATSHPQMFKHGVRMAVRGTYPELLRYLGALEQLPVQMFWGDISLRVEQYPDAVVTVTVYTLSLERTWLAL